MKYQSISINLHAIKVAGIALKMWKVAASNQGTISQLTEDLP